MISEHVKTRLKANWGDRASALACKAEVCICDPYSHWKAYLIAMNPEDEDHVICIFSGYGIGVEETRISELVKLYNLCGDFVSIDNDFRPIDATVLIKNLKKANPWMVQISD